MTQVILETADESFSEMARQLGRAVDDLRSGSYVRFSRTESWKPAINVYETAAHFVVCADLAGMPRDEIDVRAEAGRVVIRGHRAAPQMPDEHDPVCVHIMEIDSGPFAREIALPSSIDVDNVRASYRDGFLWIDVPKLETPSA